MTNRFKLALIASSLVISIAVLRSQSGTIQPTAYQTVLNNSGQIVANACVWFSLAGTTTPVNTFQDVNLITPNSNPVRSDAAGRYTAFLTPGVSYKVTTEGPCSPPSHGTVFKVADNIAAVPANSTTTDVIATAGETMAAASCAYLSDGSGGKNAGQWYKCDTANTYSSIAPAVGVLPAAISSGSTGTIRLAGLVTGLSSLTAGAAYYIGSSGAISSSTVPANIRIVGVAHSTTALLVTANPPPTNALYSGKLGALSDFAINTNKFNVTASSGNVSFAGILAGSQNSASLVRHTLFNTNAGTVQTDLQIGRGDSTHDVFIGTNFGGAANSYIDNRVSGADFFIKYLGSNVMGFSNTNPNNGIVTVYGSSGVGAYAMSTTSKSGYMQTSNTTGDIQFGFGGGAQILFLSAGGIAERARSFGMGATQDQAYSAGDFSTSGGGTWTVDSGDVTSNKYSVTGDTLSWRLNVTTSTFGTNPPTLTVKLPNGYTAQENSRTYILVINGGGFSPAVLTTTAGSTTVAITNTVGASFSSGANNNDVFFQVQIKVS